MADCSLPTKFCCCYSLKSGGKLIAGLCFITSVIASVFITLYLFSDPNAIAREIAEDDAMVEDLKENGTSARVCAGIVLILSLIMLVSSILLYKGINNKSQNYFVPFLVTLVATIILLFIISIIQFETGGFFAVLTVIVVIIYLFICIFALYKVIENPHCNQNTDIQLNQSYSP